MSEPCTETVKWGSRERGSPMAATGRITGASTLMVVSWLEQRHGSTVVDRLFDRLRQDRGQSVQRQDLSMRGTVDYGLHTTVLEEVAALTDASEEDLRAIGHQAAMEVEQVVPGAGLMLKFASPKRLLKHADRLWSTYADFGGVDVLHVDKRSARLRIHGFDTHDHFCRTLEGLFEGLLDRVGACEIRVREVSHDGADGCIFEGTWA